MREIQNRTSWMLVIADHDDFGQPGDLNAVAISKAAL
jgi:hypothetical protein